MIYGYARVSSKGQEREGYSLEAQERQLRENGASVVICETYTGATTDRPQFKALCEKLQENDILIITKLDRLARSVREGISLIDELLDRNIKVHVLNIGMMDSTPTGKLIRNIFLAFAEFEKDMIIERTSEGKRTSGNYGGRPAKFNQDKIELAMELLQNNTVKRTSELMGISESTLYRAKRELKAQNI